MADYINREAVRNELYDADAITMRGVAILNKFPSADVVEVVRCKDCKNYENGYCYHWDYEAGMSPNTVDADDFCSYGERKDNEKKVD